MMACLAPAVMKSALKKRKRSPAEGSEHAPGAVGVGFKTPSTDKKVRIGDGKSCEKAVGSADPDVDRTPIELPFHCDNCGHYILTTRYNCGKCADYDLCEACFGARQNDKKMCPHKHHASHFVVAAVDELFHDERGDVPPGQAPPEGGGSEEKTTHAARTENRPPSLASADATNPGLGARGWDEASFVTPAGEKTKPDSVAGSPREETI